MKKKEEEKKNTFQLLFEALDVDNDGRLTLSDLTQSYQKVQVADPTKSAEEAIKMLEAGFQGAALATFIDVVQARQAGTVGLLAGFLCCDKDKDGKLNWQEYIDLTKMNFNESYEPAAEPFEKADADMDGKITFLEFCEMIKDNP